MMRPSHIVAWFLVAAPLAGCQSGTPATKPAADNMPVPASAIAFSPDDATIAISYNETVQLRDSKTGAVQSTLKAPAQVALLVWSPDGKQLAGATSEKALVIWDVATGQTVKTLGGIQAPPTAVAWSPDGSLLIVAAGDPYPYADRRNNVRSEVRIFDPNAGAEIETLNDPGDTVTAIAFTQDGQRFVTGGHDGVIQAWNTSTRTRSGPKVLHDDGIGVTGIVSSLDGRVLVSSGQDSTLVVWDSASLTEIARFAGPADRTNALAYTADGPVTAGEDGTVQVWDIESKALRHALLTKGPRLYAIAATRSGQTVAAGGIGGVVRVWDLSSLGSPRLELK
jgi:dipeptidyl aminopeptidase/acylaminoacyl peptidase